MATYDPVTKTFVVQASDPGLFSLPESIAGENVIGDGRTNFLYGNSSANRLEGGAGDDFLNGGTGADFMVGGIGRDHYTVDDVGDVIIEDWNNDEKDHVYCFISYTLRDNIEDLTLKEGAGDINGTGNGLSNSLIGNEGNNKLEGLAGADYLEGGLGVDVMLGGSGNDRYSVDNSGDQVVEIAAADGTWDTVYTTVDYTLPDFVECLTADTTTALRLAGNGLSNGIFSSNGKDILQGMRGNDTIGGGYGSDALYGGSGRDVFVFDTRLNRSYNLDRVMDYKVTDDTIWLDNSIFRKLIKTGTLSKSFFVVGSTAKDTNDYVIYNKGTGYLSYDADGSGSKYKAIAFAKLAAGLKMASSEFKII